MPVSHCPEVDSRWTHKYDILNFVRNIIKIQSTCKCNLGTPDGFLMKTDKSKVFHYLTKEVETEDFPPSVETLVIEDGNALFYYMKDIPKTFKHICSRIFDMLPISSNVICCTDMYNDRERPIKSMERHQRESSER